MGTAELRSKLIEQFNLVIQDDAKGLALEGVFDSMSTSESDSSVPEEHYEIVEERRRKWLNGDTNGLNWNEVKVQLKQKHDF
ncbi:hypothetical protein N9Z01_04950 [Flavobacteriaceae bacterium]|nr:hypothetical protein [Flavobacteriaceae bacterium]